MATTKIDNSASLLETLRVASLDGYYSNLTAFGVKNVEQLMGLTMQDYGVVGVQSMEDRKTELPGLVDNAAPLQRALPAAGKIESRIADSPASSTYSSTEDMRFNPGSDSVTSASNQGGAYRNSRAQADSSDTDDDGGNGAHPQHPRTPHKKPPFAHSGASPKRSNLQLNAYGVPTSVAAAATASASNVSLQTATSGSLAGSKPTLRSDISDRIRVCVRKRPLNKKELKRAETDIATVSGRRTICIYEPKVKVDLTKYVETHEFTFDEAFDADATNEDVYRRTAFPLVEYVFSGGKATCFAYGQTGSGKTYTMLNETDGLYVMAGRDIFALLKRAEYSHLAAWVSFYEIYQGQLYDLLGARKKLFAREDGKQQVQIKGIKEFEVSHVDRLMEIFEHGNATRSTGVTGANADSSRSHAILQIVLKHRNAKASIQGKLSFIDLAGSERGADRGETDKQTRMEGSEINKSLLALKECIRALDQDSRHTPFRQSKLTQVLKDSFIGNSKTCMIATISPNMSNSEHSLNTLRYADRGGIGNGDSDGDLPSAAGGGLYGRAGAGAGMATSLESSEFTATSNGPSNGIGNSNSSSTTLRGAQRSSVAAPPVNSSSISQGFAGSGAASESAPPHRFIEEVIAMHRALIKEHTEAGKIESKLLVSLTLNPIAKATGDGAGSGAHSSSGTVSGSATSPAEITFDSYLEQLDAILVKKMEAITELQTKIRKYISMQ
eukprot:jgi/Hompol1/5648/HPOL_002015-RA